MGRRSKKGRLVNGILLLDKPKGMTSNAALQVVKRLFDANKAGHTGSLDPLATGVLPICFGEATKFSQFLLDADKHYLASVKLGVTTKTGDSDGEILEEREVPDLDDESLERVLDGFRGTISQIPSMYSALKVNGQPLYKLARQGLEVERKARQVQIKDLRVAARSGAIIELDIRCTKGTYVRTLAEDIGAVIGCGAHVIELRRLGAGPFESDDTYTLDELSDLSCDKPALDALLLPISSAVEGWPSVALTEITASYLRQGQPVQISNAPTTGWVSIFSEISGDVDEFVGVGEILGDGRIAPRRLVV